MIADADLAARDGHPSWCPNTTPFTEMQLTDILMHTVGEIDHPRFATRSVCSQDASGKERRSYNYWDLLNEDISCTLVALHVDQFIAGSVAEELLDRIIGLYEAAQVCDTSSGTPVSLLLDSVVSELCDQVATGTVLPELMQIDVEDVRLAILPIAQYDSKRIHQMATQFLFGYPEETDRLRYYGSLEEALRSRHARQLFNPP